ncbi:hypothetical protein ADL03_30570 [Nocardia sp. NRRL S-836]|nr:hypothetical protein ADL03_30570 [Nocardia sp. NRRL S-836]
MVTGGSSGIGLALVRLLAARGAHVSVVARDESKLAALHREGEPIATASADVADPDALRHAVAALQERHGPVRDAILCAGTVLPGYFTELPADTFRDQMEVNYFGIVNAVRLVVPGMVERREGTITCVSSTAGVIGLLGYSAYAPSKFAVRGLCDSLRMELKPHGIHVAGVYPADVDTPQLAFEKPFKPKELVALSGTVEPMSPQRVAAEVVRGVERRKAVIRPGLANRLLCAAAGGLPGLLASYCDSVVAKASR